MKHIKKSDANSSEHKSEIDLREISNRLKLQQKVLKKMIDQNSINKSELESKNNKS